MGCEDGRAVAGDTQSVRSVEFSPDGNRIVSGSSDKSVRVWDAKTGEQLKELQGHTGLVRSVEFSPDGTRIVSGSNDKSVQVWDAKTGEQLKELQGHCHTPSRSGRSNFLLMATELSLVPLTDQCECGM